jgi:hypothetical protein
MLLENCHNSDGQDPCDAAKACPESGQCPYNLWRLGRDIGASWDSIYSNLQDVIPWNQGTPSLSRPGRWGYPDVSLGSGICQCFRAFTPLSGDR